MPSTACVCMTRAQTVLAGQYPKVGGAKAVISEVAGSGGVPGGATVGEERWLLP